MYFIDIYIVGVIRDVGRLYRSSGKPAAAITSAQKTSPDIGNNCSRAAKLSKGGTAETGGQGFFFQSCVCIYISSG
jgi:hypothetical protein